MNLILVGAGAKVYGVPSGLLPEKQQDQASQAAQLQDRLTRIQEAFECGSGRKGRNMRPPRELRFSLKYLKAISHGGCHSSNASVPGLLRARTCWLSEL